MQPTDVWVVRCRIFGPEQPVVRWEIRAWEAEDALERFVEAGYDEEDVVSVLRREEHEA